MDRRQMTLMLSDKEMTDSGGEQDDLVKLAFLKKQVSELYQAGKFNEAIPIAQEAVELSEKALGPDHPDTARPSTIWAYSIVP